MRMGAYYYGFDETGEKAVDVLLSAVACAGKAFHHTEEWNNERDRPDLEPYESEHRGKTPVEWIQNAAVDAAAEIAKLRAELAAAKAITSTRVFVVAGRGVAGIAGFTLSNWRKMASFASSTRRSMATMTSAPARSCKPWTRSVRRRAE